MYNRTNTFRWPTFTYTQHSSAHSAQMNSQYLKATQSNKTHKQTYTNSRRRETRDSPCAEGEVASVLITLQHNSSVGPFYIYHPLGFSVSTACSRLNCGTPFIFAHTHMSDWKRLSVPCERVRMAQPQGQLCVQYNQLCIMDPTRTRVLHLSVHNIFQHTQHRWIQ